MKTSVLKELYTAAAAGENTQLCFTVDGTAYVRRFRPAERLILLGCGHIGQALCRYAADLGFSVTAVDERPGFANSTQMPEMGIRKEELIDGVELGGVSTFLGSGEQSDMSLFI